MPTCIVQAWLSRDAKASWDRDEFILVEADCVDFHAAVADLHEEGGITAQKLWTHKGEEQGVRVIHRRSPIYLAQTAVVRLEPTSWRFEEGEARG